MKQIFLFEHEIVSHNTLTIILFEFQTDGFHKTVYTEEGSSSYVQNLSQGESRLLKSEISPKVLLSGLLTNG